MLKFILCCLLQLISSISFAQKPKYTPEYLEKVKCKGCILMIDSSHGKISQVKTRQVMDKPRTWYGYNVTYYNNGSPAEVMRIHKSLLDGEYITFYENGNIQGKGKYRNSLKHGQWNSYDSTGKITKTVKYKKGNDVSSAVKYYYYFTYGLPKFREETYDQCEASIEQKWRIKYYPIAGCVVNSYILKLAEKNNRKTEAKMSRLHGPDWESKMEKEIMEICSKK